MRHLRVSLGVRKWSSYLGEADISGLLAEALTADVEAVLADQTGRVGADAATQKNESNR